MVFVWTSFVFGIVGTTCQGGIDWESHCLAEEGIARQVPTFYFLFIKAIPWLCEYFETFRRYGIDSLSIHCTFLLFNYLLSSFLYFHYQRIEQFHIPPFHCPSSFLYNTNFLFQSWDIPIHLSSTRIDFLENAWSICKRILLSFWKEFSSLSRSQGKRRGGVGSFGKSSETRVLFSIFEISKGFPI